MAWFALARILFVAAVAYAAAILEPLPSGIALNIAFALALAALVVLFESRLRETSVTRVLGALIGCAIGLALARTIASGLFWINSGDARVEFLHSFVLIVLPYLGLVLGGKHGEWLEPARLIGLFRAAGPVHRYKILDTSVIIDGRIADVCETGFVDGTLVIPQFVLKELQLVADSPDALKRNRGRRGLDILQKIQKMAGLEVTISDIDFPDVREVAEACRAAGRADEGLHSQRGKEYNQGVAYLDDGTMVVVDNARKMISRTIDIVVTSVLQTTAGKMIFGRFIESGAAAQPVAAPLPAERQENGRPQVRPAPPQPQPQQT